MCVIFLVEDDYPTEEQIVQAYELNDKGGGVAWRADGLVHWRKGLSQAEMVELGRSLPLPFAMHFRIPSCGGETLELNHPFMIEKEAPIEMTGETSNEVLMHNGHWGKWEDELKTALHRARLRLPEGPWSDSRAMAFLAAHFGVGFLEQFVPEKILIYGPERIKVLGPRNSWDYVNGGAMLVSNTHWQYKYVDRRSPRGGGNVQGSRSNSGPHSLLADDDAITDAQRMLNPIERAAIILGPSSGKVVDAVGNTSTTLLQRGPLEVPLDELPFRGDRGSMEGETDPEAEIQEAQETAQSEAGSGVEETAQGGERGGGARRRRRQGTSADLGSRGPVSRSLLPGENSSLDPRTRAVLAARLIADQNMARWARRICEEQNPRKGSGGACLSGEVMETPEPRGSYIPPDLTAEEKRNMRQAMKDRGIQLEGPL